jgi:hypothetical protein
VQLSPQHLAEIIETIKKRDAQRSGSDKRKFARITVMSRVDILHPTTGRTYTALTRDLSLEGIGLMQAEPMQSKELMAISLPRRKHGILDAQCEVTHARELADGVWGIGAKFVSTSVPGSGTKKDSAEAKRIASRMLG